MTQHVVATTFRPLNVHVAPASGAERRYYAHAAIPDVLAGGLPITPKHNLIDHHGRIIPNLTFTNFYVGGKAAWKPRDISAIDGALSAAMSDTNLNNVMVQYFRGQPITSTFVHSTILDGPPPSVVGQTDVEAMVLNLYANGTLKAFDLSSSAFCLLLPSGTVLNDDVPAGPSDSARHQRRGGRKGRVPGLPGADDKANSLQGLGGYHGSVHPQKADGTTETVYYAVGVYSEILDNGNPNGIVAFNDAPWKNVVATFYHELNEARTDADIGDAIAAGNSPSALDFLGWMSRDGEECGDFPVFEANPLSQVFQEVELTDKSGTVPIQLMYSNADNGPGLPRTTPAPLAG